VNDRRSVTLVTGAAGFAGSHLIEHLSGRGDLVAWTRGAVPASLAALATWQKVDLLDRDTVRHAISEVKPSVVYHCAGAPHVLRSWQDTAESLSNNVLATHYLLDSLRRARVECRVLMPGSAMVYAPSANPIAEDHPLAPSSPYALSKLAQEQLGLRAVDEDGIEVVVTRSFNHTGARQSVDFAAPGMARQIALVERGALDAVKVGNLDAQRDLTDVRDTVRAYALLVDAGAPGEVYNVASGVARPIRAVLDGLVARARTSVRVETDPERARPNDVAILVGDSTRLRAATGWAPAIGFEQMLDDLLEYWRAEVKRVPHS
jgi:GDP-4-dehydro-6-deoxy-D-mannose reductase